MDRSLDSQPSSQSTNVGNISTTKFPGSPFPDPSTYKPYRPLPPQDYIKPEERETAASYDLRDKVRPIFTGPRRFEGFLKPEVPPGRYVCRPLFGGLVKLKEGEFYRPYLYLVLVVALGPQIGKLVAKYWRYLEDPAGVFARDCKNTGIRASWLDRGCGFRSGGVVVHVASANPDGHSPVELAGLIPEEIWPSEADKPSVKKARAEAMRSAVAAAASLDVGGAGHEHRGVNRASDPGA